MQLYHHTLLTKIPLLAVERPEFPRSPVPVSAGDLYSTRVGAPVCLLDDPLSFPVLGGVAPQAYDRKGYVYVHCVIF